LNWVFGCITVTQCNVDASADPANLQGNKLGAPALANVWSALANSERGQLYS
jgi:hypothetical protein